MKILYFSIFNYICKILPDFIEIICDRKCLGKYITITFIFQIINIRNFFNSYQNKTLHTCQILDINRRIDKFTIFFSIFFFFFLGKNHLLIFFLLLLPLFILFFKYHLWLLLLFFLFLYSLSQF